MASRSASVLSRTTTGSGLGMAKGHSVEPGKFAPRHRINKALVYYSMHKKFFGTARHARPEPGSPAHFSRRDRAGQLLGCGPEARADPACGQPADSPA